MKRESFSRKAISFFFLAEEIVEGATIFLLGLTRPWASLYINASHLENNIIPRKLNSGKHTECYPSNPLELFPLGFGQGGCSCVSPIYLGRCFLNSPGSDFGGLGQC